MGVELRPAAKAGAGIVGSHTDARHRRDMKLRSVGLECMGLDLILEGAARGVAS
ncbi:unannotated protein [freshwater metagenome]|uniref:Unannotated protein n=1 Tax=freshwater metagenome TaxID=449393 RepID=A0A6J6GSH0_9ZZZZ